MKTVKALRWWIIVLVCLGTILNYLARNSSRCSPRAEAGLFDLDAAVFVHRRRVPDRLHDHAARVRLRRRPDRAAARVRAVRDAVVDRRRRARLRVGLAVARHPARLSRPVRSRRDPVRDEGGRRMVSRSREIRRGRLFQRGHVARRRDRAAARRVPVDAVRLAGRVHGHRRARLRVGRALVRAVPVAGRSSAHHAAGARADPRRQATMPPVSKRRIRDVVTARRFWAIALPRFFAERVADLQLLDSALSRDRAPHGTQADRDLRVDAVSRGRPRRHRGRLPVAVSRETVRCRSCGRALPASRSARC